MFVPESILGLDFSVFLVFSASCGIAVEFAVLRFRGEGADWAESRQSMTLGVAWLLIRVVGGKIVALAAWLWVWRNLALFSVDLGNPLTWISYWLVGDFIYYWTHRAEHRVRALWAGHLVHHSSQDFNLATAVRQPWTEVFYKPIIALWAPLVGFHPAVYVFFGTMSLAIGQWQHLGWFPKVRALDAFLMSPSNHRVHHGQNARYLDRNFGGSLVVWDKLFGTYQTEDEDPVFGVANFEPPQETWRLSLGDYPRLASDMRASTIRGAANVALGPPP